MAEKDRLINTALLLLHRDIPMPVDLQARLLMHGVDVAELTENFYEEKENFNG